MAVFGKSIITVGWLILIFNILYFIEITRHRYDTNLSTHIIYPTDSPYLSRIIHESRISQTWIWPCTRKHTTVTKATYKLILIKAELHVHYHDQARMPYSPQKIGMGKCLFLASGKSWMYINRKQVKSTQFVLQTTWVDRWSYTPMVIDTVAGKVRPRRLRAVLCRRGWRKFCSSRWMSSKGWTKGRLSNFIYFIKNVLFVTLVSQSLKKINCVLLIMKLASKFFMSVSCFQEYLRLKLKQGRLSTSWDIDKGMNGGMNCVTVSFSWVLLPIFFIFTHSLIISGDEEIARYQGNTETNSTLNLICRNVHCTYFEHV